MGIVRSISRGDFRPLTRAITEAFGGASAFSPASLFSGGEQGGWYDYSDMSTLFQSFQVATPVTAVEQPIGLVLDKSKGLAPGVEQVVNGNFSGGATGWTVGGEWAISGGAATVTGAAGFTRLDQSFVPPIGSLLLVSFDVTAISAATDVRFLVGGSSVRFTASAVGTYTFYTLMETSYFSFNFDNAGGGAGKNATIDNVSIKIVPGNHLVQTTSAARPVWSARKNLLLATTTLSTQSVTVVAGQMTLSQTGSGTITLTGASTAGPLVGAGSLTFTPTAGSLTLTVIGSVTNAQLEYGAAATSYQRVTTASDYDVSAGKFFARYDGVDDSLNTAATVDFTATDKMGVFAGVTKNSDASAAIVYETSADAVSNNGSIHCRLPDSPGAGDFEVLARGTNYRYLIKTGWPAGSTRQAGHISDIAANSVMMRINGAAATPDVSSGTTGAGNFGNYTLFTGARNAASLFLNGQINQLVILGRTPTALEITNTEAFITAKTVNV